MNSRRLSLILAAVLVVCLSSLWSIATADDGVGGVTIGDIDADPVTSNNEISFFWEASTTDGAELRPTFVIQEGTDAPKLAQIASYSSEDHNPMPMIEHGDYYAWNMVVGMTPCREHRLWIAHLPKDLMDDVMSNFTQALWDQMTVRSVPLRFWTRSADGSGCDLNPSRKTASAQVDNLVWEGKPKKRIAMIEWQNPGGIEPVVMVKRLGADEGAEQLASLRRAENPLAPGATSATIKGLEPCTQYRVRVYERHPNFGSDADPLRVFRGNQDRKTNSVTIRTSGCNQ